MKKIGIVFTLLTICLTLGASWVEVNDLPQGYDFSSITSDQSATVLHFALDGYSATEERRDGTAFTHITYEGVGTTLQEGLPQLPQFSRMVIIPNSGEVNVEVLQQHTQRITGIQPYPAQQLLPESGHNTPEFAYDQAYYAAGDAFPAQAVQVSKPMIMRDYRVVIVTVNPLRYDPQDNSMIVTSQLECRLSYTASGGENQLQNVGPPSSVFADFMAAAAVNFNDSARDDAFTPPSYLVIHPDNAQIEATLDVLLDWKRQKGYTILSASTAETGTTDSQIKNYIQNVYNTQFKPDFIMLAGDAEGSYSIPTHNISEGYGDQYYTLLDGTDLLPESFIGRLSFDSNFELQTIVSKIFNYEKTPYMANTDWYENILLVSDPSSSGPSTIDTNVQIRTLAELHNPDYTFDEVYNGPYVSGISNGINNGTTYFNYRGFGGMSGWENNHINALTNGFKLPLTVFLTCGTGNFASYSEARPEVFLRAGTPSAPKGAIGAIATVTSATHTCFNNLVSAGIAHAFFAENVYNMGGALALGKANLVVNYPSNPANHTEEFTYWNNLMGDPGVELWTDVPQQLNVSYTASVPLGTAWMPVDVQDASGAPLAGAWVTARMDDDLFATGLTDENGHIDLEVNADVEGNATLTVTKHNCIPHLGSITIGQVANFATISDYSIDDDNAGSSSGNGNGEINPGETIELEVELINQGTAGLSNVTAQISSTHSGVTISNSSATYGSIIAGQTALPNAPFVMQFDDALLGGEEVECDIVITAGTLSFSTKLFLTVHGPKLAVEEYTILSGSGILHPGDTAQMSVSLVNCGQQASSDISATLVSNNNAIEIVDATGSYGTISPGGTGTNSTDTFSITANTQVIPGTQCTLEIQLQGSNGYQDTQWFVLEVGEVTVTDPLGPDAYGYYCYDDGDVTYLQAPQYNWIEIDPALGGSGQVINLNDGGDMGDTALIPLPFTMQYYGEMYNQITVCSNGWVSPGSTDSESFMNWSIPGANGPSPIIAVFWDDLTTSSGDVITWFDNATHRFIVEWSGLSNDYDGSEETFQLFIYDPTYYPNTTGDSDLLMQYKEFNNVDQGSYGGFHVNHGAYATIGLEDHTATRGLCYTFNNDYPTAAKPLSDEMAIFFTGPVVPMQEPYLVLGEPTYVETVGNNNGLPDFGEECDLYLALNNIGENAAHNVSAAITVNDPYLTLSTGSGNYGTIQGGMQGINSQPMHFSVAQDVPDGHQATLNVAVTSDEGSWDYFHFVTLNAPNVLYSHTFVDDGNNNILDPEETADLLVFFDNQGGADATGSMLNISTTSADLTFNTTSFDLGTLVAGMQESAIINVTVAAGVPVGTSIQCDWVIEADGNVSVSGAFSVTISQVPVQLNEDFSSFLPVGWTIDGVNWAQNPTANAGGTAPEARFHWSPSTQGTQRLISPVMNTQGSLTLDMSFQHYLDDFSGNGYSIMVQTTSDNNTWNTAWSQNPTGNIGPELMELELATPDVGSDQFRFAFVFEGDSFNVDDWYVDNVMLSSGSGGGFGFLQGTVSLNGGSGTVQDVLIQAGNNTANPTANGSYVMPLMAGVYTVQANLDGYLPAEFTNITITAGNNTTLDIQLNEQEVFPPSNLQAALTANDVHLTWDAPSSDAQLPPSRTARWQAAQQKAAASSENTRALLGYRVYRNNLLIGEIDDPSQASYDDTELAPGAYGYYVKAVFDEGVSEASNTANVNVVLPIPGNLVATSQGPQQPNVLLTWDAPATRAITGYQVYRNYQLVGSATEPQFLDLDLPTGTYTYVVTAMYSDQYESGQSDPATVDHTHAPAPLVPVVTALDGNYPNPFNPTTEIRFSLVAAADVKIDVFNIKGEKVKTLVDDHLDAAFHTITWNGNDDQGRTVGSGIYFYRMRTGKFTSTKKMILMK